MPFAVGVQPVRNTLPYLKRGTLALRSRIKILTFNYNSTGERHRGIRQFVFWRLPQLQWLNPDVQIATFRDMTPSPFVRCYLDDASHVLIDVDDKTQEEIHDHLARVIGKPAHAIAAEAEAREKKDNPASFGIKCERPCICVVPGQVPCPSIVQIPKVLRGKYIVQNLKSN